MKRAFICLMMIILLVISCKNGPTIPDSCLGQWRYKLFNDSGTGYVLFIKSDATVKMYTVFETTEYVTIEQSLAGESHKTVLECELVVDSKLSKNLEFKNSKLKHKFRISPQNGNLLVISTTKNGEETVNEYKRERMPSECYDAIINKS